ncbi:hypothetical protein D2V08_03420 [Flagellimonas lutimaris]|uniref:Uncharacterized protein n=1 Tax=Flagellimonas lutimaris TaxID=475082 RepID=A0A3A1N9Z0_9FLAO|nr:hypothetical protein [Allomuricauda lutimaris]RIV36009.1 hypothetical protein D2V08_03420 [Allomuricauda lutimaris]
MMKVPDNKSTEMLKSKKGQGCARPYFAKKVGMVKKLVLVLFLALVVLPMALVILQVLNHLPHQHDNFLDPILRIFE